MDRENTAAATCWIVQFDAGLAVDPGFDLGANHLNFVDLPLAEFNVLFATLIP